MRPAAVIGRDRDELRNMEPNPYSALRAVDTLGLDPASCLMVGDRLSDLLAAESAGVPILRTTRNGQRRAELRALGADAVAATPEPVAACAKSLTGRAVQRPDQTEQGSGLTRQPCSRSTPSSGSRDGTTISAPASLRTFALRSVRA
ncbi:HAD family hydrolase [Streptomyces sp. NPDC055134]